MKFCTKRLRYLYYAVKLAAIAVIGAAMIYVGHFVLMRMLGPAADIVLLSAIAGGVTGALLLAAAVFVVLYAVERKKDAPVKSIGDAEALFCFKTCVPLAAGKEVEEISKAGDRGGVFCLQVTIAEAMGVQFVAMICDLRLEAVTWVSLALFAVLAATIVVGAFKHAKSEPVDADELVRKLAAYRELAPKKPKRGKSDEDGGAQSSERGGAEPPEQG